MRNGMFSLFVATVCALHASAGLAQGPASGTQPSPAPATPGSTSRTVNDIIQSLKSYKADPSLNEWAKKMVAAEPPAADDPKARAAFLRRRSGAFAVLGSNDKQVADLREAVRLTDRKDLSLMEQTAAEEYNLGNHRSAIELREAIAKKSKGWALVENAHLAWYSAVVGDIDKAKSYLGAAERDYAIARQDSLRNGKDDLTQYAHQSVLARGKHYFFLAQGKYVDAEAVAREGLYAEEKDVDLRQRRRSLGSSMPSEGFFRGVYANDEGRLAHALLLQGKLAEAELWVRSSLHHHLENGQRFTVSTGRTLTTYSQQLAEQARFAEAEAIARWAIGTFESTGVVSHAIWLNEARLARADALVALGSWGEAVAEYVRRRDGLAADPEFSRRVGVEETGWAIALLRSGKAQDAKAMLEVLEKRMTERVGAGHYDVAEVRGFLGVVLVELGDKRGAIASFRKAIEGLFARQANSDLVRSPGRALRLNMILEAYIGLLHEIRGTPLESDARIDAAAEAFALADAARGQSTQRAMAASAARVGAAGNPQLAALIRKEQDLANESNALYEILLRLAAAPAEQQLPTVTANMRTRVDAIAKERKELFGQIEQGFPQYANLIQPRLVTLKEVRALLKPGEVVISLIPGAARTFVWAVAKDGPVAFYSSPLTAEQIGRQVSALRAALDVGDVPLARFPKFDVAAAYALYRELLLPVRDTWKDAKTLLVVTSGPLSQIPLAILPTESTAQDTSTLPFESYKSVPWLIRQVAIAQLPSVNALVVLRGMPASRGVRQEFAGFGDPVFGDKPALLASTRSVGPLLVRNLSVTRVTDESIRRNQTVNWIPYSSLAPLPDTRDELLAIAKALKADVDHDVFLGRDASKEKVRSVDLASRRIIAFATHGLLPGDFPGVDQPALALSAPQGGAADNDPRIALLTLDDILSLKLDADWVVLSACNSAAGEGKGADAISGLGRAFFYAGSRALLVTHWPVESISARLLVTGLFERYAADTSLTRAEALRQSMLSLINKDYTDQGGKATYSYAHPMFWAPFSLVGDGGR